VRIVLQRVRWAHVEVGGEEVAPIGPGLLALVGIAVDDTAERAVRLAEKTARLRLFPVDDRPFDAPVGAERAVLCVSQFTLLAGLRRGNRPSWAAAAPAALAESLVGTYSEHLRAQGLTVREGVFGAQMAVSLLNDGPVTIVLDSADVEAPRG
jgi:D-aminoacyl-tRNA deacylase